MKRLMKRVMRHLRRSNRNAVILMYHQIAKRTSDPWCLSVSPEHFDQQMTHLRKHYQVLPLPELADMVRKRRIYKDVVAITFDDGFQDNFTTAFPILQRHKLPATFFISTDLVGSDQCYWWDELESIVFHSEVLPQRLSLQVGDSDFHFKFSRDALLSPRIAEQINTWNCEAQPVNERVELFMKLWRLMQPLTSNEQRSVLQELGAQRQAPETDRQVFRVMTVEQLKLLSKNSLCEIGAHTVSHPMLSQHQPTFQQQEISTSKDVIEKWTGRGVESFAYPYGNFDQHTREIVRGSGFSVAVSTAELPVEKADDLFSLPRIQVKNWDSVKFQQRLKSVEL
jgi:peptidoglycan/xylan/chitin deacetylase (PgdA/CDA1 family)